MQSRVDPGPYNSPPSLPELCVSLWGVSMNINQVYSMQKPDLPVILSQLCRTILVDSNRRRFPSHRLPRLTKGGGGRDTDGRTEIRTERDMDGKREIQTREIRTERERYGKREIRTERDRDRERYGQRVWSGEVVCGFVQCV